MTNKIAILHYEFNNNLAKGWRESRKDNKQEAKEETFRTCIESLKKDWDYILLSNRETKWKTQVTKFEYDSPFINKFLSAKKFIEENPQYEWISLVDSTDSIMTSEPKMKKNTLYLGIERYAEDINRYLQIRDFVLPSPYNPFTPYLDLTPEATKYLKDKCLYESVLDIAIICGHRDIMLKFLTKFEEEVKKNPNMIVEFILLNYILRKWFYKNVNLSNINPAKEKNSDLWWCHDYKLKS